MPHAFSVKRINSLAFWERNDSMADCCRMHGDGRMLSFWCCSFYVCWCYAVRYFAKTAFFQIQFIRMDDWVLCQCALRIWIARMLNESNKDVSRTEAISIIPIYTLSSSPTNVEQCDMSLTNASCLSAFQKSMFGLSKKLNFMWTFVSSFNSLGFDALISMSCSRRLTIDSFGNV